VTRPSSYDPLVLADTYSCAFEAKADSVAPRADFGPISINVFASSEGAYPSIRSSEVVASRARGAFSPSDTTPPLYIRPYGLNEIVVAGHLYREEGISPIP
jgi:hypothetical protein